jgi:hypothetical protein
MDTLDTMTVEQLEDLAQRATNAAKEKRKDSYVEVHYEPFRTSYRLNTRTGAVEWRILYTLAWCHDANVLTQEVARAAHKALGRDQHTLRVAAALLNAWADHEEKRA